MGAALLEGAALRDRQALVELVLTMRRPEATWQPPVGQQTTERQRVEPSPLAETMEQNLMRLMGVGLEEVEMLPPESPEDTVAVMAQAAVGAGIQILQ